MSKIGIITVSKESEENKTDEVIHEEKVTVKFGTEIHEFFCIPANLEEMIIGNLKSRGIELPFSKVRKIGDDYFEVDVSFSEESIKKPQICDSSKKLASKEVFNSVEMLNKNSYLHKKTGGTHVVGICGDRVIFIEDVSRHCAIDKAIGLAIRDGIDLSDSYLVTSCRQTASTIEKAIYCRIPIVISIAAPTDIAVKQVEDYMLTLIGFASSQRFNIYSHNWKIERGS